MTLLFTNIAQLIQVRENGVEKISGHNMAYLPVIENAFLLVNDGLIADFGPMEALDVVAADEIYDCTDKLVLPTWCDSHTHLVFAKGREQEFVDRIKGLTYEEIANRGGGILNSAKKLQAASEDSLFKLAASRINELIELGTGAIEIKSGYGLTKEAELKMLRVIKRLKESFNIPIKATFLGAHAIPLEFKGNPKAYISFLIDEVLPEVAKNNLADYIDIFCEKGYFSLDDTDKMLKAGHAVGLQGKIHVNQFNAFGGVEVAVKNKALSVDHLEVVLEEDLTALQGSLTIPVALPSCSFFLGIPYSPARRIIGCGLPLALASDFNPGSSPSGNMNFVISTACIKMKMTPEEAINAATVNGAYAMGIGKTHGSITKGKAANLILTKAINSYNVIPYAFGSSIIEKVFINGKLHEKSAR